MSNNDEDFLTGDNADAVLLAIGQQAQPIESKITELDHAVELIEQAFEDKKITQEQTEKLADLIPPELFNVESIGTDFDMRAELAMQQRMIHALRQTVMTGTGKLKKDVSIAEAKSVLDSCRNFGEMIRKNMESVVNLERIQALEAAVLATVNGYPEDFKREYLANLEKQLAIFCKES